jgi:ADP-ribose pyrophosphatase YjhB (NUDIX family)
MKYKNPALTVDVIIEKDNKIVIIRRKNEPKGLALPGGFVNEGELLEERAVIEAKEETSLDVELKELLGVYSDPKRDPRGHTITPVFIAKPIEGHVKGGDDAANAFWMNINEIKSHDFAFDHKKILLDYLKWRGEKGTYWSTK